MFGTCRDETDADDVAVTWTSGLCPVWAVTCDRLSPRTAINDVVESTQRDGYAFYCGNGCLRLRKITSVLRFQLPSDAAFSDQIDLSSAYLFGSDGVPLRAEVSLKNGTITCTKRMSGPVGLSMLWPVEGVGRIVLDTMRLQSGDRTFNLALELVRCLLMRLHHKSEDWGIFDCPEAEELNTQIFAARDVLIDALTASDFTEAVRTASRALTMAVSTAEEMTRFHSEILLERRLQTGGFSRHVFGCHVDLAADVSKVGHRFAQAVDFVTLPISWKEIEPSEQNYRWDRLDAWVAWLAKNRIPIKASPLVSFQEGDVPEWLYIWEHDFETVRDLVAEHIRRVIKRYGKHIQVWDVISGIHANDSFHFSFEQLMELTRVAASVTKQAAPRSLAIVELIAPWGEYYARNQRTIPPMLYAEMAMQSAVSFDAFGLQFCFGQPSDGHYVRDLFQVSSLLDRFSNFGKPLHITAVEVPSVDQPAGGMWHESWTESHQATWLREFFRIVLSKPFVETVSWRNMVDGSEGAMPGGGLLKTDLSPKPAFNELVALRKAILPHAFNT